MRRSARFLGGWLVLAALAGACSVKPVGKCGERLSEGVYRFCGTGQEYQCVCETGRCAVTDPTTCPESGMRYTDDESCVAIEHLHSAPVIPSLTASASCQVSPADADADADGDAEPDVVPDGESDVDTGPEAEAETGADADADADGADDAGEAEADVPPATLEPPAVLFDGENPVLLDFDTNLLLEFVGSDGSADRVASAQLLDWNGVTVGDPNLLMPPGATSLRGAHTWARCSHGAAAAAALVGHFYEDGAGLWHPLLLWIESAPPGIVIHDVTDLVFETGATAVQWFSVAGRADTGCWVAWIHDPDEIVSGAMTEVRTVRLADHDTVTTRVNAFNAGSGWGWNLAVAAMLPMDPTPPPRLMATVDEDGNLVVAAPGVDNEGPGAGSALLLGQQVQLDGTPGFAGEVVWERFDDACVGSCAGIESPEGNAIASTGNYVALAYVLADAAPSTARRLMHQVVQLTPALPSAAAEIATTGNPARMPNLVVAGGSFVGAYSQWEGDLTDERSRLWLFDLPVMGEATLTDCCVGAFSALSAGRSDEVLATWYSFEELDPAAPHTDFEMVIRMLKLDNTPVRAPDWPAEGFRIFDPLLYDFGGDPSNLPRGIATPDGGAAVVFTANDGGTRRLQFVRVVPGT